MKWTQLKITALNICYIGMFFALTYFCALQSILQIWALLNQEGTCLIFQHFFPKTSHFEKDDFWIANPLG